MSPTTENTPPPAKPASTARQQEGLGGFFENFSLDSLDKNLLWQIPLFGGALWFLGSMFFGKEEGKENERGLGFLGNLLMIGGIGTAIWYFFGRRESMEELADQAIAAGANPDGHDYEYGTVGGHAYRSAYDVEMQRAQAGNIKGLHRGFQDAVAILERAQVQQVDENLLARADATVDVALQVVAQQRAERAAQQQTDSVA